MNHFADIELPSNRKFGLFMAAALAAVAIYLSFRQHPLEAAAAALVAVLFASFAALRPGVLTPVNKAWMMLGAALGLVVTPITLGILFFAVFTPIALVMRMAGRDELRLRRLPSGDSYWRLRTPPGPQPDSFRRQF